MAKIRKGFVSNSSSSSFILSTTNIEDKLKIEIDVDEFMNKVTEHDYKFIKTKEELINHMYDYYVYVDDEHRHLPKEEQMKICFKEEDHDYNYEECLEDINNGKTIIIADVDNNDYEMFETVIKRSHMKIISDN